MKIETIRIDIKPVEEIIKKLGVDRDGEVQKHFTNMVNLRMTKYMPAGPQAVLSTKLKFIKSPTEIVVLGPYAHYQYEGKKMVNAATGKGPALIPGVGYRYKKGTILKVTGENLNYENSRKRNPLAGPHWDKRMMAAEGKAIAADLQVYCARRNK